MEFHFSIDCCRFNNTLCRFDFELSSSVGVLYCDDESPINVWRKNSEVICSLINRIQVSVRVLMTKGRYFRCTRSNNNNEYRMQDVCHV